jgi:hypothetical protein
MFNTGFHTRQNGANQRGAGDPLCAAGGRWNVSCTEGDKRATGCFEYSGKAQKETASARARQAIYPGRSRRAASARHNRPLLPGFIYTYMISVGSPPAPEL